MSEKRIVGLDIGSYAVKVVYLELKGDVQYLGFDQELVGRPPKSAAPPPVPGAAASGDGTEPDWLDDEATNVREAPTPGDADQTNEMSDVDEAGDGEEAEVVEVDEPAGPAWQAALQRLADRGALAGEYVATFVPDGKAMTIQLPVPFEEKNKVESVLPHLMVDRLPIAQGLLTWDFQTYPNIDPLEEGARAFVGFSKNEDLAEVVDALHETGTDPVSLGIPELLLASAGVRSNGVQSEPVAFVDLGHETTRVVVVRGRDPLLARSIRVGGKQITEAIAEAFDSKFADAEKVKHQYAAIVDEATHQNAEMRSLSKAIRGGLVPVVRDLRRTFQGLYARDKVEVTRVMICGGTSRIKNLENFLSAELGIPVRRIGSVPAGIEESAAPVAHMAAACAISFQIEAARQRTVNLRRGRFAYRGKSSYLRRQMMIFAAAAVLMVLALGVTLYAQKKSYEAQRDAMRAALSEQTKSLFGKELLSQAEIQKAMAGDDGAANSFIPRMSAYQLLHEITTNVSPDITLTLERIEVDSDRNLVQIYGETTDAPSVDRIVSDLKSKVDCFKEVKPDKVKVRDDKADFELQISSGCS